jgi:hypothetical protein
VHVLTVCVWVWVHGLDSSVGAPALSLCSVIVAKPLSL